MKAPFWKKLNKDGGGGESPGFAEKFTGFFSAEPQKEKILRHEDFTRAGDVYYASVSARYKVAQRILVLLLVFFLLFSIFTNIREITYGNLFYFVRDFGNAVDIESTNYETLSYDVYQNQNFSLYRGGIAAVSPSNVSVFTATGRRTLKSRADFVIPYSVCSDKYVLVYDMSGNSFALYNSFSKVYTESFDYPITDAAISDSGAFAVLTRSSDYKSVINVYNKSFKLIGRYSKNLYALDLSIDEKGERMAVLFYDVGDGRGRTTLRVYDISNRASDKRDPDEDRILCEREIECAFPISCSFNSGGGLSVITDSSILLLDGNLDPGDSIGYNAEVSAVYTGENGAAVALGSGALNDRNRIIAFDGNGKLLYDETVRSSVREISVLDKYVFIKSDTGAMRLNTQNGDEERYDCQSGRMLVYDSSTAIICAESKAIYIKFKD